MLHSGTVIVGRKKSDERKYTGLIRVDADVSAKAKKVAALRGISVAEYATEVLRKAVDRDFAKEVKKLTGQEDNT